MRKYSSFLSLAVLVLVGFSFMSLNIGGSSEFRKKVKITPTRTNTPTLVLTSVPKNTFTPTNTPTDTPVVVDTPTDTPTPTDTVSVTDTPTPIVADISPYPSAPLCPDSSADHDYSNFHTLWDSVRGCHYDHEHGMNPFTAEVENTFPGFDLLSLLGGVEVGHTNPSSSMENTMKHGGFKWDVTLSQSVGCHTGPNAGNSAGNGVDAFVAQYHNFGNYAIEFESRVHSAVALMRQCLAANPTDYGYIYVVQHQDYGQRIVPYQGLVYPYPDTPLPEYPSPLSPYFSIDCIGSVIQCRSSRQFVLSHNANSASTWTSAPQAAPISSPLFAILFRLRDTYQLIDWNDQTYPFSFVWMCSNDDGATFTANVGCRYNNSTSRIHELHGTIPATWDNLAGFDTDLRVGRITAEGYVTAFGTLNMDCVAPNAGCFPIKLVSAFVGRYRSTFALVSGKGTFSAENLPERDICFTSGGAVISCDGLGAISSGWIGPNN